MDLPTQSNSEMPAPPPYGERPKPLPAWWAILPTIAWVGAACVYAQPIARRHASSPQYGTSYFIGQLIAAPLLGSLIGWIVYRIAGRLQLAGTIAYSLVCLAMAFSLFHKFTQESTARLAGHLPATMVTLNADVQPQRQLFPVYGLSLQSPPGWQQIDSDKLKVAARWIAPNSTAKDLRGMVLVEVLKPKTTDGKAIADSYASEWHGRVLDELVDMDGEKAWQVQVKPTSAELQPVSWVLAVHEGRLYIIDAGVAHGQTCQDQVDFIRRSWRWVPAESPLEHLQLQAVPTVLLDGQLLVKTPNAMRPFAGEDPKKSVGFELYDYKQDIRAINIVFTLGDLPAGITLDAAEQRLAAGSQQQFHLKETFAWRNIPSNGRRVDMTQAIPGPNTDGVNWIAWGVVGFDRNRFVLVNISAYDPDPARRAKYIEAGQKIIESISIK